MAIGGDPKGDIRSLILALVNRIAVHTDSISVELRALLKSPSEREKANGRFDS